MNSKLDFLKQAVGDKQNSVENGHVKGKTPPGAPTGPKAWGAGSIAGGAMKGVFAVPDATARRQMTANSTTSRKGGQSRVGGSQFPTYSNKPYSRFEPVLKRSQYRAGMIISAAHVERDGLQRIEPGNRNKSVTNEGTIAHEKERKFVVLRVFATHITVLPIFTHNSNGLASKEHKNQFISIRELDDKETAAPAESDHPILWSDAEANLKDGNPWNKMSDTAAVHFTNPKEHKLTYPAKIMGRLDYDSFRELKTAFNAAFNEDEYDEDINPTPEPEKRKFDGSQAGWGRRPAPSEAGRHNGHGRSTYGPSNSPPRHDGTNGYH